ncbi:hypothetical protein DEU38_122111 [Rhodococcus sp. AG1013]|nr:hypothetical protein DEU38_122111 [Rhodococcus sp. AG1013]
MNGADRQSWRAVGDAALTTTRGSAMRSRVLGTEYYRGRGDDNPDRQQSQPIRLQSNHIHNLRGFTRSTILRRRQLQGSRRPQRPGTQQGVGPSAAGHPKQSASATGDGVDASHVGTVLVVRAAEKSGPPTALSVALEPWRKPLVRNDPGKIGLDLAMTLALGDDCLADIAQLHAHPEIFGPAPRSDSVPPGQNARHRCTKRARRDRHRLRCGPEECSVRGRRRRSRPRHRRTAPADHRPGRRPVTAHSEKEYAAPNFIRGFGFHPLDGGHAARIGSVPRKAPG